MSLYLLNGQFDLMELQARKNKSPKEKEIEKAG